MSRIISNTALPLPTAEYSQEYMNRLIQQLTIAFTRMGAVGPIVCGSDLTGAAGYPVSGLTIVNVPTSPTDLPVGSIWCDTTANNVLKIVT